MIKAMALIKRKPTVSHEEFVRHYEEVHAPLALKLFPMIKKYVRNHVVAPLGAPEPDFDCVTEFWFDSPESAQAVVDIRMSDVGKPIRDDEETFMDMGKMISFLVDERVTR
ncbi:MAG: EthD family reductase [Chloroflexi bacterium]|nr:EthD family reductase [Chloroflexota bacterium]